MPPTPTEATLSMLLGAIKFDPEQAHTMVVGSDRGPVVLSTKADPYLMETGEPAHEEARAWFAKAGL